MKKVEADKLLSDVEFALLDVNLEASITKFTQDFSDVLAVFLFRLTIDKDVVEVCLAEVVQIVK